MVQEISAARTPTTHQHVPAERCAHCKRELPTVHGTHIEYVGVVGPECVRKYAPLIAALKAVDGLEAHEEDQGSMRLARHVIWSLRGAGVAVKVVDSRAGVRAVQIVGLSRPPKAVVKSYGEIRAEFEQRLKQATAEREAQSWVAA